MGASGEGGGGGGERGGRGQWRKMGRSRGTVGVEGEGEKRPCRGCWGRWENGRHQGWGRRGSPGLVGEAAGGGAGGGICDDDEEKKDPQWPPPRHAAPLPEAPSARALPLPRHAASAAPELQLPYAVPVPAWPDGGTTRPTCRAGPHRCVSVLTRCGPGSSPCRPPWPTIARGPSCPCAGTTRSDSPTSTP